VGLNQRVNSSDKESKRFVNLLRNTSTNSMPTNRAARCQNVAGMSKEKSMTSALYQFCCSHHKCDVKLYQ
jgi:hypothetical protein